MKRRAIFKSLFAIPLLGLFGKQEAAADEPTWLWAWDPKSNDWIALEPPAEWWLGPTLLG